MRWNVAALACLLSVAGCGHDPEAGARTAFGPPTGAGAFATDPGLPAGVTARRSAAGNFLADARAMTLYTYAQDTTPGKSACNTDCARLWPPLAAPAGAQPVGAWAPIARDDGTRQWAWHGKPLYTYSKDGSPGATLGDRVGNSWSVAYEPIVVPPGLAIRAIYLGRILTDERGHTLYLRGDERGDGARPRCTGRCLEDWLPLPAPLLANRLGDWKPLTCEDGTRQWAYQGHRLYLNVHDLKPGEASGDGAEGIWRAAVLEPMPPLPAWVTVQRSDMGEIFADARGFTLYTLAGSLEKIRQTMCDDACIRANWRPVMAAPGAAPSGEWTLVPAGDGGGLRWAYKGSPVFTHTRDTGPGAISGDKWAAGVGGGGGGFMPIQRRRDFEE